LSLQACCARATLDSVNPGALCSDARCVQVTCGSVVKLQHLGTGADLHSHEVAYGSGSGQQSVTAMADPEDANSFWAVRAPLVRPRWPGPLCLPACSRAALLPFRRQRTGARASAPLTSTARPAQGEECPQGTALKSGARVRLQHVNTRAWLHSHHFPSPLTQNQEARPAARLVQRGLLSGRSAAWQGAAVAGPTCRFFTRRKSGSETLAGSEAETLRACARRRCQWPCTPGGSAAGAAGARPARGRQGPGARARR